MNDTAMGTQPEQALNHRRLAYGAVATGVVNGLKVGLQILMLPLMARLLGPSEFGLYALALPVVGFLLILADGGLGNSMAREPNSNVGVWSTAFWVMQLAGIALALLTIGISLPLAYLTGQPRLPPLMAALSVSYLFVAWAVLPNARLLRDARLELTAFADLIGTVIGAGVAIVMALRGFGAWSLAAQFCTTFAARATVMTIASPLRPRAHLRLSELNSHLGLGGSNMAIRVFDYLSRTGENGLVQRFFGAVVLGSYSLSNQAPRFLCDAVGNPIWASMYVQGLHRSSDDAVAAYYRLLRLLAVLLLPSSMLLAAVAEPAVQIFLGPSWQTAASLLALLLPAAALASLAGVSGALLYARGHGDLQVKMSAAVAVSRVMLVAVSPWVGLGGVAVGIVVINAAYLVLGVLLPRRYVPIRAMVVAEQLSGPAICSLVAAVGCYVAVGGRDASLWWTAACVSGGVTLFLLLMLVFDRRKLIQDFESIKLLMSRGSAKS